VIHVGVREQNSIDLSPVAKRREVGRHDALRPVLTDRDGSAIDDETALDSAIRDEVEHAAGRLNVFHTAMSTEAL
jgi:hypothetical protein